MNFKSFSIFVFAILAAGVINAQANFTTINYNLSVTFTSNTIPLTTIGGNLTLATNVPLCTNAGTFEQTIYSGNKLSSAAVNVDNITGNGCVTVIATTSSGKIRTVVPAGSQSGVLRFANVSNIIVTIDSKASQTVPETMSSTGKVDFWF